MRVGAIDCGTNSIRLLIADGDAGGALTDVHREMRIVRLGQGVDRTGRLAPEAIERTRVALADYATTIGELGAEHVRMVATSATRDAANRVDFVEMVRHTLGVDPEVITGDEEARLTFLGAVAGLPRADGRLLVADIGGGSTELVLGDLSGVLSAYSMDVGCVRLTERHLHGDPPTPDQIGRVVDDVRAAIAAARHTVAIESGGRFVGVAGTVTTIVAIALGLDRYDADAIHGATIGARDVAAVTERLLAMTHDERAALPVMHPGRVDVIGAGALVLRTIVEESGTSEVIASEHDILDGIASTLLSRSR
ncbi:MAG: exopolyphosphatase / guanosine-5-triphosphate,3-diphosphate pyrophosphatase [Pseudonocardiales bacterium]|jgi:exopolyphosphatase/guanosine-5'-triphosphate,3'-diphosphate pyrophosphatase|nr:exopolyphosphatase / guanosine-5-triphosphate,3-diphosphate pyrophosphatase [Pseudonocardiales bacterium]